MEIHISHIVFALFLLAAIAACVAMAVDIERHDGGAAKQ